jgi:predicted  nucleic acid-binding Zn-ribbon protein
MNKSPFIVLSLIVIALVVVVVVLGNKYKETTARYAETKQAEETVRNQFNSALVSLAEIQESLESVVPEGQRVVRLVQDVEPGSAAAESQRDHMLGTISNLKETIDLSKRRIRELEESLQGSQIEIGGLRRLIDGLKRSVTEKETMISRLTAKVDSLTVTVVELRENVRRGEETIDHQATVIEEKTQELATVFYTIGTKKELKEKGIITEKGGVIGIGKSTVLSAAFREGDFTALDTDRVAEIQIPGREPQVLSAQTASSYEIQIAGDGAKLVIKNPREFRKVKYLVVMVKED